MPIDATEPAQPGWEPFAAPESPPEAQPVPPPEPPPERPAASPRRRGRIALIAGLVAVGIAAVAVGGFALSGELTREPTARELTAAKAQELDSRWRNRTAGEIFPATVQYEFETAPPGAKPKAHRIGIAAASGCAQALDRQAAEILALGGCRTVLRATYVDDSGTLVSTIGIAVMPSVKNAGEVDGRLARVPGQADNRRYGLLPVGFVDTVTDRFGADQRQQLSFGNNSTPYVFFAATGWADGRKKVRQTEQVEDFDFAQAVLTQVMSQFLPSQRPCAEKSVEC
ncbi:hypothetical protein [Actinomadura alba]|uniref:Uncharacterized protein n=1 Tax=Actinomadura alba TaxID=406431 RepID=A0ABR7LSK3_9ACTN|nr:hypothetical protein [Actinomadura alba]MBC6467840.1 hypothetical protein [Actinomadura alba]